MANPEWQKAQQEAAGVVAEFDTRIAEAKGQEAIDYFSSVKEQQQLEAQPQQGLADKAMDVAGAVAKDIGLGVIQMPRSVARGSVKAVNNLLEFADYVGDLAPTITMLNSEGEIGLPRVQTSGEVEKRTRKRQGLPEPQAPQIPVPDKPVKETVTGGVIEAISQFLVGFGAAGKAVGVVAKAGGAVGKVAAAVQGSGVTGTVAKGAIADVLAFDAHEQRLSNVIQQVPALQNPVTEYLQADPNDGAIEAKFKQAIEGVLTGAAGEALFRGVRALRSGKAAVTEAKQTGVKPEAILDEAKAKQSFDLLGDANSPELVVTRKVVKPAPDLTPEQVTGDLMLDERFSNAHRPPTPDFGAPAFDLTSGDAAYPDDIYSKDALTFYGTGDSLSDKQTYSVLKNIRNKPDAEITIYRAVPKNAPDEIKTGDWVTLSKNYAQVHGEGPLGGDYKIISAQVKARELYTNADSINEFGFWKNAETPKPTGAARAPQETDEIAINFARIEGPDDVKNLMQSLANDPKLLGDVQKARRGVVSDVQLKAAAEQEDAFSTLMARRTGQALNDQQILAARELYAQTTDRLLEAARVAASTSASSNDQFVFRKLLAVHSAVQSEVLGARAEAARALRAWSLPVGASGRQRVKAVEDMLEQYGGVDGTRDLAKRLAKASEDGMLSAEGINKIANGGALARSTRALQEIWSLGLLTSPKTHVVNIASNVLNGLYLGAERMMMSAVPGSGVKINEGVGYFIGYVGSFREALRNGAAAFKAGASQFGPDRIEAPMIRSSAREILDPSGKAGWLSKAVDYYGYALNRAVGGTLAAGDDFGRTMLYNAELRAQAIREANSLGLTGEAFTGHVGKVLSQPSDLTKASADAFAKYGVFMNELGAAGKSIQTARQKVPLLGFVVPFVQTPANIFKFTFGRTPVGLLSEQIRNEIAEGGAKGAARMAGLGMGTTMMMMGADMAMQGEITGAGPSDPALREQLRAAGWQPYSVKIGDKYYSYQKVQPIGTWLALSANLTEILGNYENYDIQAQQEVDKLVTAVTASMADVVLSASFMTGSAELVEALSDPIRYGEQYVNKLAASLVPSVVGSVEQAVSPEIEQAFNMIDAIKARIPGLSDSVPKRRNPYGEVVQAYYPSPEHKTIAMTERMSRVFNPILMSDDDRPSNKLTQFFMVNGLNGPQMPNKTQQFDAGLGGKVSVDLREYPQIYDRFLQLRGEIKPLGYNATLKEFMRDAVNGKNQASRIFTDTRMDTETKDRYIQGIVSDYDDAIRQQLLSEFPVLQQTIADEAVKQQAVGSTDTSQGLIRTKPLP